MEPNLEYVRSAAYHEAAHVVIAAVQGIPLTEKGIHLDRWGRGLAHYRDRKPDSSINVGSETEREKTIIATAAGWIAQNRNFPCSPSGASYDIDQINALLTEMYPEGSLSWRNAKETLLKEAQRLVERHWAAIESVALTLWAKPETSKLPQTGDWSTEPLEKYLSAEEVVEILQRFGISARIESR